MDGETDIDRLLATMSPELRQGVFVFVTLAPGTPVPAGINPVMIFREREGTTLILLQQEAEAANLDFAFRSRMITLNVHSSLEAVGFIAAIATRLAAAGMGVNPVAGYFHDHLFIPAEHADDAMKVLREMAGNAT